MILSNTCDKNVFINLLFLRILASLRMKDCCYRVVEIKIYETEKSSWMEEEQEEEEKMKRKVGFTVSSHIRTVVVYK